mgnify:FL=1
MIVSELNGRRLPRKSQGAEMSAVSEHIGPCMMCPSATSTGILPWSPQACIRLRTIDVTEFFRSLRTSSPMGRGIE